jgi:hypothetical protein
MGGDSEQLLGTHKHLRSLPRSQPPEEHGNWEGVKRMQMVEAGEVELPSEKRYATQEGG